jgi:signal transduction histidine kinase
VLKDKSGNVTGALSSARDVTERNRVEAELKRYQENLEGLVKERTQDMEDAQEALTNILEQLNQKSEELEKANIRLKELDRLKSMFIASMSHELRTPLNSIIGFTGIILQGIVGPISEEQKKQLAMVKSSANHLLSLINDVIDISKIESGKVELYIEEFDLSYLMKDVIKSFEIAAEKTGLQLALNIPEELIMKSDERRVRQVIMNLVSNAVKFTEHGSVRVTVRKVRSSELGELKKVRR